jgi:hypothetical protein
MSLAVLEPEGRNLSDSEQWILSHIAQSLTGDFNRYSAMTIVERQAIDRVLRDQHKAQQTGYYSDSDFVSIGKATNARYILTGSLNKIQNSYTLTLFVMDIESQERKATYPITSVSLANIQNLSAVKQATADLLTQLGVTLTATGRAELLKISSKTV